MDEAERKQHRENTVQRLMAEEGVSKRMLGYWWKSSALIGPRSSENLTC
jgi:hypothetical protein